MSSAAGAAPVTAPRAPVGAELSPQVQSTPAPVGARALASASQQAAEVQSFLFDPVPAREESPRTTSVPPAQPAPAPVIEPMQLPDAYRTQPPIDVEGEIAAFRDKE